MIDITGCSRAFLLPCLKDPDPRSMSRREDWEGNSRYNIYWKERWFTRSNPPSHGLAQSKNAKQLYPANSQKKKKWKTNSHTSFYDVLGFRSLIHKSSTTLRPVASIRPLNYLAQTFNHWIPSLSLLSVIFFNRIHITHLPNSFLALPHGNCVMLIVNFPFSLQTVYTVRFLIGLTNLHS